MPIKSRMQAAGLCALFLFTPARASAENRFLFHTQEMPRVQIESSKIVGSVRGGSVEINIYKQDLNTDSKIVISALMNEHSLGEYSEKLSSFSGLDLSSTSYFADQDRGSIKIEIRFSEERECFVNDDGRDRLVVTFGAEQAPEAYMISYDNCEPEVRSIESR